MNPYLSIIIPAYNEAHRIKPTLDAIFKYLSNVTFPVEIIIVDDGSTDETVSIVRDFKNVVVLLNEKNRGKGYSVKKGMLAAKGELRLFLDADHSVHISNLDRFMTEFEKGSEIIIGSIELPGAVIEDANYSYRRHLGKMAKWLIRTTATPGIYDTQRGFKLFTKKATEDVFTDVTIDGWGFDIESISLSQKKGYKIKELPVEWLNSKASSVNLMSYFKTLIELVKIKMGA